MLEKALKGSKAYYLWLGFLLVLIGIAAGLFRWQIGEGLGITGMSRDVSWGLYIAQFTFLVGVAASAVMVVLPYYLHNFKAFGRITVLGEFLAIPACLMCMLFIFVDMGRPDRVVNVFLHPTPSSMMFWDSLVLMGYLLLNIVIGWTTLHAERKGTPPPKWIKPLIYLSIPWAVSIHTVTAFLYQGLPGRSFWMTAILAPRFLASAFAAGPALLILLCLITRRVTKFDPGKLAIQKLGQIITYAMLISLFFFAMEFFTAYYSNIPEHKHHFEYLYLGHEGNRIMVPFMWASLVFAVIAVVLLVNPRTRQNESYLALGAVAVFLSSWLEKGLGLITGGFVPSPMGDYTTYQPTWPEAFIAIGIWAVGFFVLTILYKVATGVKLEAEA